MPKKLHYISDSSAPQSPAKPLQDLIALKKNAAHCRRWAKAHKATNPSTDCHQKVPSHQNDTILSLFTIF